MRNLKLKKLPIGQSTYSHNSTMRAFDNSLNSLSGSWLSGGGLTRIYNNSRMSNQRVQLNGHYNPWSGHLINDLFISSSTSVVHDAFRFATNMTHRIAHYLSSIAVLLSICKEQLLILWLQFNNIQPRLSR